ncbi:MAG: phospholipase C, phosphocholine-specific [Rhizomicrobium sp.]|jgi:phospholipase C
MADTRRRDFLKLAAAAAGVSFGADVIPSAIRKALAVQAANGTRSIRDVEHVVILMQENRSFDHYFGTMRGVRGFSDPRPVMLPSGDPVWRQPRRIGHAATPFHLDTSATAAQCMPSLDHSWKGSHARWKHYDAWIAAKGEMTMGHFGRADIPFYYALADAFTICDAYHCSVFGPTNPNRMFLFTGTSGLSVGNDGIQAVANPEDEPNETADASNDAPKFEAYNWMTYAERLQAAGIDWRVYQEYDNYGDNALAYFARFRNLDPQSELYRRARSWVPGSGAHNAKDSRGQYLVDAIASDVANGRLPQVSWIVAPYIMCEHPSACPGYGESLVTRLLDALTARPDVFAKTVFILNYDENDGFFDHIPPAVPPIDAAMGKSTVEVTGEIYRGEPFGLGPRVPLLIVSPWTKGGFVNSQLFDHTSVIRFLEARFGVLEPNITPWRRTVCGDLTSAFDFGNADASMPPALPSTGDSMRRADETCKLVAPVYQASASAVAQEKGQRPARALPYALRVGARVFGDQKALQLTIENRGAAGIALTLYADGSQAGPWFYTVEPGKRIEDRVTLDNSARTYSLFGPNGFLRTVPVGSAAAGLLASADFDAATETLVVELRNASSMPAPAEIVVRDYGDQPRLTRLLAPGESREERIAVAASDHWYDIEVHAGDAVWRFAGHGETGRPSMSDPAFGRG